MGEYIYASGPNRFGELGNATTSPARVMSESNSFRGLGSVRIQGGVGVFCLEHEGKLHCAGSNPSACFSPQSLIKREWLLFEDLSAPERQIQVDGSAACELKDGGIRCAGDRAAGVGYEEVPGTGIECVLHSVSGLEANVTQLSMNLGDEDATRCAVKGGTEIYCWGKDVRPGTSNAIVGVPVRVVPAL